MKLSSYIFVNPMKKFPVRTFLFILLSTLLLCWYGQSFSGQPSFIDHSPVMSRQSFDNLNSGKGQSSTFVSKSSTSRTGGGFSRVDVAEIEDEQDKLHFVFIKKKLNSTFSFCVALLYGDRLDGRLPIKDLIRALRDSPVLLLERHLKFQVLRI